MKSLSQNGLDLIKSFEGCRLTAYKPVSTEKYYTIGYGHYGSDVKYGMKITQQQAEELLRKDCQKFVAHVNTYDSKYNFTQNQFDALVSFAYNIGSITQLTQKGTRTIAQISNAIPLYNKGGGKVLNGLVKRRAKEKELFDKNVSVYYNKYSGTSESIIEALIAIGETNTSLTYRKKIAQANSISNYKGSATQNIKLLALLKQGKLIKP